MAKTGRPCFSLSKNLPNKRSELVSFYNSLIRNILTSTKLPELTIIARPNAKSEIENFIRELNVQTHIRFLETSNIQDIWIRDFSPLYCYNKTVCKALYNPRYFAKKDMKYADLDDKVGIEQPTF